MNHLLYRVARGLPRIKFVIFILLGSNFDVVSFCGIHGYWKETCKTSDHDIVKHNTDLDCFRFSLI